MYEKFFGLREKPFSLLPDPSFLYLSPKHANALSLLEYALSGQAGISVITGEIGSGKTTLLRQFLQLADHRTTPGVVFQTHRDFGDLLSWVLLAFGINPETKDKTLIYQTFLDFLVSQRQAGKRTILIVDEAQNLTVEGLEELRLLSNVNFDKYLFLQIVLTGQPELLDKLKLPELRQLAQRVAVHYHLSALSFSETRDYIHHRLKTAGGDPAIFDDEAIGAVFHFTGGMPRLINSLCDMALVYAFGDGSRTVTASTIWAVAQDREASGLNVFPVSVRAASREEVARETERRLAKLPTPERSVAESSPPAPAEPGTGTVGASRVTAIR